MDLTQRFEAMQTELRFLRAEMELNRKYIFERPLLIVAGGITAGGALAKMVGFHVLPVLFIVLMGYNLWFTYNRVQSNARIISYLQLVHTPAGASRWIGWEAGLREFRMEDFPRDVRAPLSDGEKENRFYGPIYSLHILSAFLLTGFLLAQVDLQETLFIPIHFNPGAVFGVTGLAIVAFLLLCWVVRPAKVRDSIYVTRDVWEEVLPPRFSPEDPALRPEESFEKQSGTK